jgi:virulence-associated protein VapD
MYTNTKLPQTLDSILTRIVQVDMLVGSDEPGSRVLLGVRKHSTHELVDVPLRRVPEFALETMVALFKKITVLKQNGQRMKAYEAQTYLSGQEMTVRLSDHIAHLISKRELERRNFDTFGAQIADKEATSHLTELEQQMDHLSKTLTDPSFENSQQIIDIKNREIHQLKSMLEVKEDALRMAIRKVSAK